MSRIKERTPYGYFVDKVDLIDKTQGEHEPKKSFKLCGDMGFIHLKQLFKAGKEKEFMEALHKQCGIE